MPRLQSNLGQNLSTNLIQGTVVLYPSIKGDLACPSRFTRAKVHKEHCTAPFASTVLGSKVHEHIAKSLRSGLPASQEIPVLPRRLILNDGESLDRLLERAHRSIDRFNVQYRPQLITKALQVEKSLSWDVSLGGRPVRFLGKVDLILEEDLEILDWKTGSLQGSHDQLRLYLFLVYQTTGKTPSLARAVSLESGEEVVEPWSNDIVTWGYDWLGSTKKSLDMVMANPQALNPGPACRYCPYAHACPASAAPARYLLDTRTGELEELLPKSPSI